MTGTLLQLDYSTLSGAEPEPQQKGDGSMLDWALRYAALGMSIVPIWPITQLPPDDPWVCVCPKGLSCDRPGKHVMVSWKGYQSDRATEEQIRRWFDEKPAPGIEVVCGWISGLVDIEIDPRNGGEESWEQISEGKEPIETWTSRSGGGGLHRFFRLPEGGLRSRAGVSPGIDVQAEGKLAVLPPSRHRSGKRYVWLPGHAPWECELADIPEWLLDVVRRDTDTQPARATQLMHPPEPVNLESLVISARVKRLILGEEGSGDRSRDLYAVECYLIAGCYSDETIAGAIWHNPIGEKARDQGIGWLMDDIARARAKTMESDGTPPLPPSATLDPRIGVNACPWLDDYIAWSRLWSPRSYDDFHENCGLAVMSIVAARRVVVPLASGVYTNLYLMFAARSSIYAKTTAIRLMGDVLREANLTGFLAADDITPERLLADMGGYLDDDDQPGQTVLPMVKVGHRDPEVEAELRKAYASQRGWIHNELGRLISGLANPNGYLSTYRSVLREMDDCPERFVVSRLGRPKDRLERPYLTILGSLTPADLKGLGRTLSGLFTDGLLARFAIVCPPKDHPVSMARFPRSEYSVPPDLASTLRDWHFRLPQAEFEIETKLDEKGKPKGRARLICHPVPPTRVGLSEEADEMFTHYNDALLGLMASRNETPLDSSYARLANRALRVAGLMASISGKDTIGPEHWAKAQAIAERWRHGLHNLWGQLNSSEGESKETRLEDRILSAHRRGKEAMTSREVTRGWKTHSRAEINAAYAELVTAGELVEIRTSHTIKYGIPEHVAAEDPVATPCVPVEDADAM